MFSSVSATATERQAVFAGDGIIARPDVVMERVFTVAAPPAAVAAGMSPGGAPVAEERWAELARVK